MYGSHCTNATPHSIHHIAYIHKVSLKPFVSLIRLEDSSLKHICYRKKENHKKDQLFLCRTPMMWYVAFLLFSMAVYLYAIFYSTVGNVHIRNGIHSYEWCWLVKSETAFLYHEILILYKCFAMKFKWIFEICFRKIIFFSRSSFKYTMDSTRCKQTLSYQIILLFANIQLHMIIVVLIDNYFHIWYDGNTLK